MNLFIAWFLMQSLKKKWLKKMVLKLFTIFIVVEHEHLPSCPHPNLGLLPGVIANVIQML